MNPPHSACSWRGQCWGGVGVDEVVLYLVIRPGLALVLLTRQQGLIDPHPLDNTWGWFLLDLQGITSDRYLTDRCHKKWEGWETRQLWPTCWWRRVVECPVDNVIKTETAGGTILIGSFRSCITLKSIGIWWNKNKTCQNKVICTKGCCVQMCPCSAAGGWSVEVWRWVEAGEHQLGGWRYGGGGWRQHQTRPPGTVLAVAGGWVVVLAMGPGHPSCGAPSPRHWSLLVTAACPGTWSLVCSLLRSGRDLTKHCWGWGWLRSAAGGREDEAALGGWRDAAPAASRPAAATVHCTLYCTLYSWPGRCTPEVGCQTPAGGWWWLECPDNVITTLSLLPAHIFSTLLPWATRHWP